MIPPGPTKHHQQQNSSTDVFIWLGKNMIQVVILMVLIAGGAIAFMIKSKSNPDEARSAVKTKWSDKSLLESRYSDSDCDKNLHCRQLKRIYAEGGASKEAIRKNILEADKTVRFEHLQENAARYEGIPWAFEGKIFDIVGQEKRGIGDYILADIIIGEDEGKQLSVKGDFATNFVENDYVYVVGYITGMSNPRMGPSGLKHRGSVPSFSARAFLKPGEAREILAGSGAN